MAAAVETIRRYQELGFTGVAISLLSSVFMSTGLCLQKLVQKNAMNSPPQRKELHKNVMYITGVLYVCVGYILRIALYGFLPLSTLAPLSAITIICSIALEYIVLKDELKQITVICSICIMAGVVMCIFSANLIDENYSLQSIQSLFLVRFNFVMTVSLCATILCCKEFLKQTTFFVDKNVIPKSSNNRNMNADDNIDENNDNMNDKSNRHNHSSNYQGESNENDEVSTYSIAHDINSAYYNDYSLKNKEENLFLSYLGFFYLIFANAIFTGWFSVSSKAMIEIIKYVFIYGLKTSFLTHPGIFILLFLLPICSTIKLKYTWYALSVYSPLQYIPLYQSGVVLTNSLFGLIYFQDFSVRRIVGTEVFPGLYFAGLFCICVPLAIMTFRYNPRQHYPSSTAVESVEDETQGLIQSSGNNSYAENYGNYLKKNNFPSIRSDLENSPQKFFSEQNMKKNKNSSDYNNYENYYKDDDKNMKYSGNKGDEKYITSPYRSYGASDILIKSNEKSPGVGVKIPSKIPPNNGKNNFQEAKEDAKNTKNGNSFGFTTSKYLSPNTPTPTKNVSFSGIACEVNGVEESAAGKGPPLALYIGSLQGINNYPLSASEDEKEGK